MKSYVFSSVLGALLLVSCSGSETEPNPPVDAGELADAAPAQDAAAAPDSGPQTDAGMIDAGPPPDVAYIDLRLIENLGNTPIRGVEVCLHDLMDGSEDCKSIERDEGVTFVSTLNRQVYFLVRGTGFAASAIPHYVDAAQASITRRVLSADFLSALVAQGQVTQAPNLGMLIAGLQGLGSEDPALIAGVTISSDDPNAQVRYSGANIDQGIDPEATSTSSAASEAAAAGLFGLMPGQRQVRLRHPTGVDCEIQGLLPPPESGPFSVAVFEGVLTIFEATCDEADRGRRLCSVFEQDCPDAEHACRTQAFTGRSGYNEIGTLCEPPRGTEVLGASCTRPTGAPGDDTCAPGLYCAYWGQARSTPQARTCHEVCDLDHACGADERCLSFGNRVPTEGTCVAACDPLDDRCGAGLHCATISTSAESGFSAITTCLFEGPGVAGDACNSSEACADGHICAFDSTGGTCRPVCGPSVPCEASGETCRPISGTPSVDLGVCR